MATNLTQDVISSIKIQDKEYKLKSVPFHGTATEWENSSYIPKQGEIIIYDAETASDSVKIKIGDGNTLVHNLPFVDKEAIINPVYTNGLKLADVDIGANELDIYAPVAGSTLGLVKSGGDVTISNGTITVKDDSHNHVIANVDGLQTALDSKGALIINATLTDQSTEEGVVLQIDKTYADVLEAYNSNKQNYLKMPMGDTNAELILPLCAIDNETSTAIYVIYEGNATFAAMVSADMGNMAIAMEQDIASAIGFSEHANDYDIHFSADERTKLNGIENGANKTVVDTTISNTSTNPVQNKVIYKALEDKLSTAIKGKANGLAELDSNGKVPTSQLPSLLALGETSSTAYRGDRGKIAYDHSQTAHAPSNAEKNQNAFSKIAVDGQTSVEADDVTDTFTLVAGNNVTITTNASADTITINAKDTTYSAAGSSLGLVQTGGDVSIADGIISVNNAKQFTSKQSVALTGDVTGNASSQAGWTVNTTLATTGVTAGSYGQVENASPAHKGTFSVPYFTVDSKGRITSASTKTITLPSDTNTDTKVTQDVVAAGQTYPILLAPSGQIAKATTTAYFDSGVTLDVDTNTINANVKGTADQVANSLHFGAKSYNGSSDQTITAADLGLESALRFIGTTTTALSDGDATNPILINGNLVTAPLGSVTIVSGTDQEFVWMGTAWEEFGNASSHSIKGHTHKVTHTPAGSVSKPTFTGTEATISSNYTPSGTITAPTFIGDQATITVSFTPGGSVSQPTFTGDPVDTGKPKGTNATTSVYSITDVGTLPSLTFTQGTLPSASLSAGTLPTHSFSAGSLPTLTSSVSSRCLTLTFGQGSLPTSSFSAGTYPALTWNAGALPTATFSAGTLPTRSSAISLPNANHVHEVTAAGTITKPTFTGAPDSASSVYTPSGTISTPTFTGTPGTATAKYTPAGNISKPTFTGTEAIITTTSDTSN